MPEQREAADEMSMEDAFGPIERTDYDLDEAMDEEDVPTGYDYHSRRTGLFGGGGTVSDPEAVRQDDDADRHRGFDLATAVYGAIDAAVSSIEESHNQISARYPRSLGDLQYGRPRGREDPFTSYKFDVFLSNEHRAYTPVTEAITDFFETEYEGSYDVRGVEFEFDHTDPSEKFRAVFPWVKRDASLAEDDLDGFEFPAPIQSLVHDLWETPQLPEFHQLTVTVYTYRDNVVGGYPDTEFQPEHFSRPKTYDARVIDTDRRDLTEQALDNAHTDTSDPSISYTLTLTAAQEEIDALIEDTSEPHIQSPEDFAKRLGQQHFENNYGDCATVGVVNSDVGDEEVTFKLAIQG